MTKPSAPPLWVALLFFGAAGCDSEVSGAEAVGAVGTGGSSAGSGGAGGVAGNGGAGGGDACEGADPSWLQWHFESFDGTKIGASKAPMEFLCPVMSDVELDGAVTDGAPGTFTIDSCQPGTGCSPMLSTLTLDVKSGFDNDIPVPLVHGISGGAFVHVRLHARVVTGFPQTCLLYVAIANLPAWGAVANPVEDSRRLWMIAQERSVDGWTGVSDPTTEPFTVKAVELCKTSTLLRRYRLEFGVTGEPAPLLSLLGGEHGTMAVMAGEHAGSYDVRNLRSFESIEPGGDSKSYTILRSHPAP